MISKKILLNILLVFAGIFCSILLGLGSHGLFASKVLALWQYSLSRDTLIALFCVGIVGLAVIAAVLFKNRRLHNHNGGKPENLIVNISLKRRVLNYILILTALLGPVFFVLGFYFAISEAHWPAFFCLGILEPTSIIAVLTFLKINTKYFSKMFLWLEVPILLVLLLIDLYCFIPLGVFLENRFNINIYGEILTKLYGILAWLFG